MVMNEPPCNVNKIDQRIKKGAQVIAKFPRSPSTIDKAEVPTQDALSVLLRVHVHICEPVPKLHSFSSAGASRHRAMAARCLELSVAPAIAAITAPSTLAA